MPQLRPVRKTRVSDEAVVQLANLIISGQFAVGEKLPSERELAAQLAINRTSLREALRRLEEMGLLIIRPGEGNFVQDYGVFSGLEFLKFIFTNGVGLDKEFVVSLAEIRRLSARDLIELAAERADAQNIARLREVVKNYPREATSERLSGYSDWAFFYEVAKASKNKAFLYLMNSVRSLFEKVSAFYFQVEGDPVIAADLYQAVVDAIAVHDKARAVSLFDEQMKKDDQQLLRLLEGRP